MKLSAKQQKALLSRNVKLWPILEYDSEDDCPFDVGEHIVIERDRVWLTIDRIRRSKKGKWVAHYVLTDFRAVYSGIRTRQFNDETGKYDYEPEKIEDRDHDRIHREAGAASSMARELRRMREEKLRTEARLSRARRKGSHSTVRSLTTRLEALSQKLRRAA